MEKLPSASYPPMDIGLSSCWQDALPHTNQLELGKRCWNLATSSAVIKFWSPYHNYRMIIIIKPTLDWSQYSQIYKANLDSSIFGF